MSGHQYIRNTGNLFADDDDVDDETFLKNSRPKQTSNVTSGYNRTVADLEQQRQVILERQREIEQRTLDSSHRSISLLRDSEQVGIETAHELLRQREQLENTNKRLDDINSNLRSSQKHLNGIKSVFSSLKNYLAGRNEQPRSASVAGEAPKVNSSLSNIPEVHRESGDALYDQHPSVRLKGLDASSNRQALGHTSESQRVNKLLDANLDEMVGAIERLKGLGMQLGEEIDSQNDLIDVVQDKTEIADLTINKQNKQMNKLLGK